MLTYTTPEYYCIQERNLLDVNTAGHLIMPFALRVFWAKYDFLLIFAADDVTSTTAKI
jgi:hypothetical protein